VILLSKGYSYVTEACPLNFPVKSVPEKRVTFPCNKEYFLAEECHFSFSAGNAPMILVPGTRFYPVYTLAAASAADPASGV